MTIPPKYFELIAHFGTSKQNIGSISLSLRHSHLPCCSIICLLAIVSLPRTFGKLHISKDGFEMAIPPKMFELIAHSGSSEQNISSISLYLYVAI